MRQIGCYRVHAEGGHWIVTHHGEIIAKFRSKWAAIKAAKRLSFQKKAARP